MAGYEKFEIFAEDLAGGVHDLIGTDPGTDCDILEVYLSDATIDLATDAVKADVAEIANGNGYTAGGIAITNNGTRAAGTVTVNGLSVQVVATGTVGPFTHTVLFNETTAVKTDPLIAKWSRAGALTLENGESFDMKFSNQDVGVRGTIFTLA